MQGDNLEEALNWILANGELLAVEDTSREEAAAKAAQDEEARLKAQADAQANTTAPTQGEPSWPSRRDRDIKRFVVRTL